jgi:hypothetical protein
MTSNRSFNSRERSAWTAAGRLWYMYERYDDQEIGPCQRRRRRPCSRCRFFRRARHDARRRDAGRGRMGGPRQRARRGSSRHRYDADPRRARAARADEVSQLQNWSISNLRSHRRTRWASGASCLPSKASTTPSRDCAPKAENSSARWPSTRTSTDSATCEGLRASSSRWPRNSSEAFRWPFSWVRSKSGLHQLNSIAIRDTSSFAINVGA